MSSQSLNEQENLHIQILGFSPRREINEELPFYQVTLYLFWKLFKDYSNGELRVTYDSCSNAMVIFTLDPTKTKGVEGSFLCKPELGNNKSFSYSLEFYNSQDPDFSGKSGVQCFSAFCFSAGYCPGSSNVQWGGYAWTEEQIESPKETSLNISGPKFESKGYLKNFSTDLFLVKIITDYILPLEDWIEFKQKSCRNLGVL